MATAKRHLLAGVLAGALTLGFAGAAQADSDDGRSSAWALGNILHGLATAMTGGEAEDSGGAPQIATLPAAQGSVEPSSADNAAASPSRGDSAAR